MTRPSLATDSPWAWANGKRVKELRNARGWTQEELAEQAEISPRTVEKLEAGKSVRHRTLMSVAEALGVSRQDIEAPAPAPKDAGEPAPPEADTRTATEEGRTREASLTAAAGKRPEQPQRNKADPERLEGQLEEANRRLQKYADELRLMGLTDPLTGLYNRRPMEELARVELARRARDPSPLSIGLIDADHFKNVNQEYGMTGGDEVLKGLARLLSGSLREVDSVGRVGGDEFLVIARDTDHDGAVRLAERIRSAVANNPVTYRSHLIPVTVSVGFAVAEAGAATDYYGMLEEAAAALSLAKAAGRNRCEVSRVEPKEP
jgi:diguanylate cyclase (GGDEF)-like protein